MPPLRPDAALATRSSLEHDDLGALLCECERRGKSGEAAADDRDICIAVRGPFGPGGKWWRGIEPVGLQFHSARFPVQFAVAEGASAERLIR